MIEYFKCTFRSARTHLLSDQIGKKVTRSPQKRGAEIHKVATSQLAADGQVEQRSIPDEYLAIKDETDRPYLIPI